MSRFKRSSVLALGIVLVMGACSSGPPSVSELKVGKTKDVAQAANTFDARDHLYAIATIDNPPKDGKVLGRLLIVDVEGQQPGPIPGIESALSLTGGMNTADFHFTPPDAGWPNGKYQFEVVLTDASGIEKDKKTADITTAGNQPAATTSASDATTASGEATQSTTAQQ
jgi:hypothetical protein